MSIICLFYKNVFYLLLFNFFFKPELKKNVD